MSAFATNHQSFELEKRPLTRPRGICTYAEAVSRLSFVDGVL